MSVLRKSIWLQKRKKIVCLKRRSCDAIKVLLNVLETSVCGVKCGVNVCENISNKDGLIFKSRCPTEGRADVHCNGARKCSDAV